MKYSKSLLTVSAALVGLILALNLNINAQSLGMRVNIPFEFHVGDKALPAGTYTVERRGEALLISDARGNGATVLANPIQNRTFKRDNWVVFRGYGDQHFLSEVRWSEYSTARGLMETKAERALASNMPSDTVKLAAIIR
jgi:hypothetical protein